MVSFSDVSKGVEDSKISQSVVHMILIADALRPKQRLLKPVLLDINFGI